MKQEDAKFDGFNTLDNLLYELNKLNGIIEPETIIFQHWIENAVNNENAKAFSRLAKLTNKEDKGILPTIL